jgi:hypothetical protein
LDFGPSFFSSKARCADLFSEITVFVWRSHAFPKWTTSMPGWRQWSLNVQREQSGKLELLEAVIG